MKYYKFGTNNLKDSTAMQVVFQVDEDCTEIVIIGEILGTRWATVEHTGEYFDDANCVEISKKEYRTLYEEANYIISQ